MFCLLFQYLSFNKCAITKFYKIVLYINVYVCITDGCPDKTTLQLKDVDMATSSMYTVCLSVIHLRDSAKAILTPYLDFILPQ